jgi:ceramide glucosyltransferase
LPFALAGGLLTGFAPTALTAIAAALGTRLALALLVDRAARERTAPLWWIPARDLLSFVLFLATFFGRSVDWRGASFTVDAKGLLSAQQDKRS